MFAEICKNAFLPLKKDEIGHYRKRPIPENQDTFQFFIKAVLAAELAGLASCSATRPKRGVQFSGHKVTGHKGPGIDRVREYRNGVLHRMG